MTFTPGPWAVSWRDGQGWKVITPTEEVAKVGVVEANARLIAAAPLMLEALEEVVRGIDESAHWWLCSPLHGGFDINKMEAVIAKAKGETP